MEIQRIDSLYPIRKPGHVPNSSPQPPAAGKTDEVQVSAQARLRSQLRAVPEIRAEKVEALRKSLESGSYETTDKWSAVAGLLLDDLS